MKKPVSVIAHLTALLWLTACGMVRSEPTHAVLPDVKNYTQEQMNSAAIEIERGSCPVIGDLFMSDYKIMRDQTRAANQFLR